MKDPRRMPADAWRPLAVVAVLMLATDVLLPDLRPAQTLVLLALLGLVACGASWARLVLCFAYAFGTALAVVGVGWLLVTGGPVPADDARPFAGTLLNAAALICLTSPAVRAWTARPAAAARAADRQDAAPV
ncbi:hypothetical protein [Mumia sp. DW29H23]|uniref:hypothetical protein n=1 Tax=Mumia sp. DW29H23 TaxID=3421241 RepID=UPI003D68298B